MEEQLSRKIDRLIDDAEAALQQDRARFRAPDADHRDARRLRDRRRHRLCRLSRHLPRAAARRGLLLHHRAAARLRSGAPAGALQVRLERALVNARMIYEILDIEPQQGDAPDAAELDVDARRRRASTTSPSAMSGRQPVLRGVSFVAEAGKTTAHRRRVGRRQIDADRAAAALLRPRRRAASRSTARTSPSHQAVAARHRSPMSRSSPICSRARSATISATAARTPPTPRSRRRRGWPQADDFIRAAAAGLRHAGRRKRRDAVRRPAPAPVDRPRHRAQRADPAARRGDLGARQRVGGARAGGAGRR